MTFPTPGNRHRGVSLGTGHTDKGNEVAPPGSFPLKPQQGTSLKIQSIDDGSRTTDKNLLSVSQRTGKSGCLSNTNTTVWYSRDEPRAAVKGELPLFILYADIQFLVQVTSAEDRRCGKTEGSCCRRCTKKLSAGGLLDGIRSGHRSISSAMVRKEDIIYADIVANPIAAVISRVTLNDPLRPGQAALPNSRRSP